jgi:hypothetical protein
VSTMFVWMLPLVVATVILTHNRVGRRCCPMREEVSV